MDVRKRIIHALDKSGKTRQDLANKLNLGRAAVSDKLNKEGEFDSLKYLEATAEITGFSFEWLRTGKGEERQEYLRELEGKLHDGLVDQGKKLQSLQHKVSIVRESSTLEYLKGSVIRPITVTVDRAGKELISYVPVKAQAGYLRGFGEAKYLEKLPAFTLPINIEGTFRMFQVDGNSMLQLGGGGLHDGDIVIANYVENIFAMKDNRVYVVVSTEGVLVKRCLNRLNNAEDRVLICNSDNKNGDYPPIILHPHEILEVWELKAFISRQLSFSTDLWQMLGDIQAEQAILREKVIRLEQGPGK